MILKYQAVVVLEVSDKKCRKTKDMLRNRSKI